MATSSETTVEAPNQWTEAEYASALRQMEVLQGQINSLRSTIPSLIEHFTPQPVSTITPAQLYYNFANAAKQASSDVKKCRMNWQDDKSLDAFDQARASIARAEDLDWEYVNTARWHNLEGLEGDIVGLNLAQDGSQQSQDTGAPIAGKL